MTRINIESRPIDYEKDSLPIMLLHRYIVTYIEISTVPLH